MFFLIEYNRPRGLLCSLRPFADGREAADARLALESKLLRSGDAREVVTLEAESEGALRRTHARYFYDLATLAERLASRTPEEGE